MSPSGPSGPSSAAPAGGLRVANLTAGYDPNRPVLREISLELPAGSFCGIVGPNGSGKSTLLKAISGTLRPTGGEVTLGGEPIHRLPPAALARRLAVVGADTPGDFEFSVLEVVLMGRFAHLGRLQWEGPEDEAMAREALALVKASDLADRSYRALSSGERQRVALARALCQEPEVLLLDEPTSHLDLGHQAEVFNLLESLNQKGLTVVAVLHDLNLAARYCPRLVVLEKGRLAADGHPAEVLTAGLVQRTYGSEVAVIPHPLDQGPQVVPLFRRPAAVVEGEGRHVHVIGGGGAVAGLLSALVRQGCRVTLGPVNRGDTDWSSAHLHRVACIDLPPFTHVTPEAAAAHRAQVAEADLVVVGSIAVGPGNLDNLQAAAEALQGGKPLLLVDASPVRSRDFTGGEASRIWRQLAEDGAVVLPDGVEAAAWVGKWLRGRTGQNGATL